MAEEKKIVLCIDDDEDVLATLRIILEKNGYAVESALTAEEGLQKFKDTKPNVIISDLMMEEIDSGTNFVKEIRAAGGDTPIFLLSSVGDQLHQMTDFTGLGLAGIFQKPINPDALIKTLETTLS